MKDLNDEIAIAQMKAMTERVMQPVIMAADNLITEGVEQNEVFQITRARLFEALKKESPETVAACFATSITNNSISTILNERAAEKFMRALKKGLDEL